MPPVKDNQGVANAPAATPAALPAAIGAGSSAPTAGAIPAAATVALTVREGEAEEPKAEEAPVDTRLDRLPMQVDVLVKIHSFRVQDLLSMEKGTVVETVHEHTQDVPVRCGGALLLWSEFEVLDQRLAVRVTRLA